MLGYVLWEADAKTGFDMKKFTGVIICEGNSGEREREEAGRAIWPLRRRKGKKKERLVYVFRDCLVEFPVSIIQLCSLECFMNPESVDYNYTVSGVIIY